MSNSQPDPTQQPEPPCDFLGFLQTRLGVKAADDLGEWLAHYEPGPVARANANAVVGTKPLRSSGRSQEIPTKAAAA